MLGALVEQGGQWPMCRWWSKALLGATGFHMCTVACLRSGQTHGSGDPAPLPWPVFKCWLLGLSRSLLTNPSKGDRGKSMAGGSRTEAPSLVLPLPSSVTLGKCLPLSQLCHEGLLG